MVNNFTVFPFINGINPRELTKKEIIEQGWVEKYVLGLTSEEESSEVERLAYLYPEVQENINEKRNQICGTFNRSLTQPALRYSLMNKRKMMILTVAVVSLFSLGFCFLAREHFSLKAIYSEQNRQLLQEQAKVTQLASIAQFSSDRSTFMHSPDTRRIKLKGGTNYPEAEAMIFHSEKTGKMMLRVIDLPELEKGQHYGVWAIQPDKKELFIGQVEAPVRFDSLYTLDPVLAWSSLQLKINDPSSNNSETVCLATADH